MTARAWAWLGSAVLVLGLAVLWFGYAQDVVAQRQREALIQGALSRLSTAARDPLELESELRRLTQELEHEDYGLSEESRMDLRYTLLSLLDDAARIDSTAARVTVLRLVGRIQSVEADPQRRVGRAGLLFVAAGAALVLAALGQKRRVTPPRGRGPVGIR